MMKHSFTFCGVDMRERFGLIVESFQDSLQPKLRARKLDIPMRDGAYDYGAKWYEERNVTIQCATVELLTRAQVRELSLALSEKGELRRWDEPDKTYIGQMYDPTEIERVAGRAKRFKLTFVCEPFAYGQQKTEAFQNQKALSYAGSARTPTHIIIANRGATKVHGLVITMREDV